MKATAVVRPLLRALVAVCCWLDPAATQVSAEVLVLTRANLIDGISAQPRSNMTVVVRDGRIERVSAAPGPAPPGATVIDLNGRWLLPGLIDAHVHLRDPGGEYNDSVLVARARAMLPRLREVVVTAWRMGVKVAAGSDMRYAAESHRRVADEIEALEQSGLSAMGAIQAATSSAAECLGVQGRTGSIRAGLEADLIVVDGDPLANLRRLREAVLVVNNGRVVVNRIGR